MEAALLSKIERRPPTWSLPEAMRQGVLASTPVHIQARPFFLMPRAQGLWTLGIVHWLQSQGPGRNNVQSVQGYWDPRVLQLYTCESTAGLIAFLGSANTRCWKPKHTFLVVQSRGLSRCGCHSRVFFKIKRNVRRTTLEDMLASHTLHVARAWPCLGLPCTCI